MRTPAHPVSFNAEQIKDLNQRLSNLRHDINNHLSLIMAATELIKHKPQMADRMMATLTEQPPKITAALSTFTTDFENAFGISPS